MGRSIPETRGSAAVTAPRAETEPAQASTTHPTRGDGPIEWKGTERYEVLSCLGNGGMGVVYEVFDRERRQLVALKTLLRFNPAALYLFKQEFRTLADVQHANLVHLYELVVGDVGETFFTMELVRGVDFLRYVRKPDLPKGSNPPATLISLKPAPLDRETVRPRGPDGPRPAVESAGSLAIMGRLRAALRQLVEGVHTLHNAGKLHRDIKPSNVLVTHEGRVVLLDFGVATELSGRAGDVHGGSGEVVGTARYMAPEQAYDEAPTPASDWYSVGVVLYEALVGRPPFVGSSTDVITMKGLMDPTPPGDCVSGIPPELDTLCRALLHRDAAMRPTGAEILRRLGVTRSGGLTSSPAAAVDTATALIGRDEQLQALRDAFETTRSGRMITVRVGGAGGMGKSTVVHHILDELVRGDEALVLRGRAYERETVPYKAIDSVIDALSRHLLRLSEADQALPLPDNIGALGRLFPVLQRVPGVNESVEQPNDDLASLRRRAFGALRDLLTSLAERQPLVLFVDDAQWGDVDSAVLLLDLLRGANPPPVLLVMTYRDDEVESSPFLKELRERWPASAEACDVPVGPLSPEDARRLALTLLDSSDAMAQRTARAVARESRGSPFLIEELVRTNRSASTTEATLAVLTLEQMVGERLARLPDEARRLVEIVAVGGMPLPVAVIGDASGLQGSVNEVIAFASARRFVRTGLRDGRDVVETSHDRFRETIVAQLPRATLREHHGRLARVLEHTDGADAEAIAMHYLGADDKDRAARYAEIAADQAAAKLAFDQAARLYRLTLENLPASSSDVRRLRARLAMALELGGRSIESARVYLLAADGANANEQVEYQRAAAEHLLAAGRIDEGAEILHRVLGAVGMSAPRSPLSALFWLIVYRIWVAALGLRFKEREPGEVTDTDRLRVDALQTVAAGFGLVDIILGACMHARHYVEALRKGDRFQVMRAVSYEVAQIAATEMSESKREKALVALGRSLSERQTSADDRFYFEGRWGIACFIRAQWRDAQKAFERGLESRTTERSTRNLGRLFLARTYYFLGDLKENVKREAALYAEAEDRGDLNVTVSMRTSTYIRRWLAEDDPDHARRDVQEALAEWSEKGFFVQHWQAMVYGPDIDLYVGDGDKAYERFARDLPALKRSLMLRSIYVRAVTEYTRGRVAIASIASNPSLRSARMAEARRAARNLRKESMPFAALFAAMVEATVENAAAQHASAIVALRDGIVRAVSADTLCYIEPLRYRLGQMLGGDEGRTLVENATAALTAQGIKDAERWVAMHLPGTWGPGSTAASPPADDRGAHSVET